MRNHNANNSPYPHLADGPRVGEIPKIRRRRPDDKEESGLETNKGGRRDGRGEERKEYFDIRPMCLAVFHPFRSSLPTFPFFPPLPCARLSLLHSVLSPPSSNQEEIKKMRNHEEMKKGGGRKPIIIDAIFRRYRPNPFNIALNNALSPHDYWCIL